MEKEYTHLGVRGVMNEGRLIHAGGPWARVPRNRPLVDEDCVLVGLVCRFIGSEAYTVVIDDDETYERWANSYGQSWFPAGAIGHLYSFPKEMVPKHRIEPTQIVVVQLNDKEFGDLSKRGVS